MRGRVIHTFWEETCTTPCRFAVPRHPVDAVTRSLCCSLLLVLVGAGVTLLVTVAATGKGSRVGRTADGRRDVGDAHAASGLRADAGPVPGPQDDLDEPPGQPVDAARLGRDGDADHESACRTRRTPTGRPDGKTIAFQSYKSGTFHIWAMNPDGSNVRELTDGFYDDREPQYSPDGTKIAFSSDRPPDGSPPGTATGSYNIWTLTLATGQLTEVTHQSGGANDYYPTWTPDGKHDHLRRHQPRDREHRRRRVGRADDAVLRPRQHLLLADVVARRQEPGLHRARQPGDAHPALRQRQRGVGQRGRVRLPGPVGVQRQPHLCGRRQDHAAQPLGRHGPDDPVLRPRCRSTVPPTR